MFFQNSGHDDLADMFLGGGMMGGGMSFSMGGGGMTFSMGGMGPARGVGAYQRNVRRQQEDVGREFTSKIFAAAGG